MSAQTEGSEELISSSNTMILGHSNSGRVADEIVDAADRNCGLAEVKAVQEGSGQHSGKSMSPPKGKRGRRALYQGAQYPALIDEAKLILPLHNYDLKKVLELDLFEPLRESKDVGRFLSKYILNQDESEDYQPFSLNEQIQNHSLVNQGAKIQSEITSNYLREYMLLQPTERYDFLEKMFQRNSQSLLEFLSNLKTTCSSNFYEGMFSLVHELMLNSVTNLQIKSRLFVQSLLYYKSELLRVPKELIQSAMTLLAQRPNTEQTLGLANFVFFNEVEEFTSFYEDLVKLDQKNIGIIPLMAVTFSQFRIDAQVIRLLPNTLLCLNKPFIKVLKQDYGLKLIREIPVNVVGDFVQVCALSSADSYESLNNFISNLRDIFVVKWDYLDQEDFALFISELQNELKNRNPRWVSKLGSILDLAKNLSLLYSEKGIKKRPDIVIESLGGNAKKLDSLLNLPKRSEILSQSHLSKAIKELRLLNQDIQSVQAFCNTGPIKASRMDETMEELQSHLGIVFLELQRICYNYLVQHQHKFCFTNFGIGNGKTLLCTSIGVYHALKKNQPVIILGKNDHLVLRDEKNYESLIVTLGLNIGNSVFLKFWQDSVVIVDEYDWIMFDGSPSQMQRIMNLFKQSSLLIGFTGSRLSQKEKTCLEIAFSVKEIIFPSLGQLRGDRRTHLDDEIITSNQAAFQDRIFQIAQEQTHKSPVLIVAQTSYHIIESNLQKRPQISFFSFKNSKASKIEASLEGQFTNRDANGRYGVYLLTESQGRGTDLKTSKDILQNGGLYLIISDVFSRRSQEQIVGRIGRLDDRGQWRYIIYCQSSKDTAQSVIKLKQDLMENEIHLKFSRLQSALSGTIEKEDELLQANSLEVGATCQELKSDENLQGEETLRLAKIQDCPAHDLSSYEEEKQSPDAEVLNAQEHTQQDEGHSLNIVADIIIKEFELIQGASSQVALKQNVDTEVMQSHAVGVRQKPKLGSKINQKRKNYGASQISDKKRTKKQNRKNDLKSHKDKITIVIGAHESSLRNKSIKLRQNRSALNQQTESEPNKNTGSLGGRKLRSSQLL